MSEDSVHSEDGRSIETVRGSRNVVYEVKDQLEKWTLVKRSHIALVELIDDKLDGFAYVLR